MADLATALAEEVTCAICHEYFTTPKVLGCMHRFCRNCLHKYITKHARENGISCPVCRQITRPPQFRVGKTLQPEEWVDKYPTDCLVQTMVENLRKQKSTDDCSSHQGNPIVLFCQDCQKLICHVCAGVDHRKCDGVVSLRSEAEKERTRLKNQLVSLQELNKISSGNEEDLTEYMNDLNRNYDKASSKLQGEFSNIRKLLSAREKIAMVSLRQGMLSGTNEFTTSTLEERCNKMKIADSERRIIRHIKTRSDAQLLREKLTVEIPVITRRIKRPVQSSDDMYETVAKRFKIEEMKKHLHSM